MLKYMLFLVVIILIAELSSKPILNEEMLIQSTAVTPSVDPNAADETAPELNLEWGCDKSCQQRRRLWELLLETNKQNKN